MKRPKKSHGANEVKESKLAGSGVLHAKNALLLAVGFGEDGTLVLKKFSILDFFVMLLEEQVDEFVFCHVVALICEDAVL